MYVFMLGRKREIIQQKHYRTFDLEKMYTMSIQLVMVAGFLTAAAAVSQQNDDSCNCTYQKILVSCAYYSKNL